MAALLDKSDVIIPRENPTVTGGDDMTAFIAPEFASIPAELQALPRWLVWKAEPGAPGEKPRKVPYSPGHVDRKAKSTTPNTWGTFAEAKATYLAHSHVTGVGFVLNGDGVVGVDLDNCVIDGEPSAKAMALLVDLGATYIEVSPSGNGLRAIGYGEQLDTGVNGSRDGIKGEFYSTGRYLTLTGKTIKAGPIAQLVRFKATAESFRVAKKTMPNAKTGKLENVPPDERNAALMKAILSGDVYHDSLRDLAASMIATGMQPGAVVNNLRGMMDAGQGEHDARWKARRAQIPDLVSSAVWKFAPPEFDVIDPETGEAFQVHPLAKFVDVGGAPKPPRWVIPGFIGHGVVVIAGAHGVGKTTALVPLAMTAAGLHGEVLMPREWRHVVYITEDVEQVHRILAGIVGYSNLSIDIALVRERLHIVVAVRLDPEYVATVGKSYREHFTRIVDGVEVLPLVVLDTKSAVLALDDENGNSEASRMMAALKQGFDGLPVWLIGHVAKANINNPEASGLTIRGASAVEGDANQTVFLVRNKDRRFLVLGKVRFDPTWQQLEITSHTAQTIESDEFGNPEIVKMLWGIAAPAQQSCKEAAEHAAEQRRKEDDETLCQDIRDAVDAAWQSGNPLNRAGIRDKIKRKNTMVVEAIRHLLSDWWLYEVLVPPKDLRHPRKKSYFISLTAEEREAALRGEGPPVNKLVVVPSWRKTTASSVPVAVGRDDQVGLF